MSDLQFNEEYTTPQYTKRPKETGLIGLLINNGIVKNRSQANLVLVGVIIVLLIISVFAILSLTPDDTTAVSDPTAYPEIEQ